MTTPAQTTSVGTTPVVGPRLRRRWRATGLLAPVAVAVVAVVASPLGFVIAQAAQAGWDQTRRLLGRPLIATLLWHTLSLAAAVTLATAVLGFGAAYLVERTTLPGRRAWTGGPHPLKGH